MPYYKFKNRTPNSTDHQKIERKLDDVYSECIRLMNSDDEGNCHCITCNEKFHWRDIDCGHYIDRIHKSTRWHLQNSHPQCRLCNGTHDGRAEDHGKAIDLKYGPGTADKLEKLSREEKHFMTHELKGMYEELRLEVKALKAEKFGLGETVIE